MNSKLSLDKVQPRYIKRMKRKQNWTKEISTFMFLIRFGITVSAVLQCRLRSVNHKTACSSEDWGCPISGNDIWVDIVSETLTVSGSGLMACISLSTSWKSDYYKARIRTVKIKDTVQTIQQEAFSGMTAIENVDLSEAQSLRYIDWDAFNGCTALKSIDIPATVFGISYRAFMGCTSLESVTFGASGECLLVGMDAFKGCSRLQSVFIERNVIQLAQSCFRGCSSLRSFTMIKREGVGKTQAEQWISEWDSKINQDRFKTTVAHAGTDLRTLNQIKKYAFQDCSNLETVHVAEIDYIWANAFLRCHSLKDVRFDSISSCEYNAFQYCSSINSFTYCGNNFNVIYSNSVNLPGTLEEIIVVSKGVAAFGTKKLVCDANNVCGKGSYSDCGKLCAIVCPTREFTTFICHYSRYKSIFVLAAFIDVYE